MANIKQQKKRVGIAQRQRRENLRYRSSVRTLFRQLRESVARGDKDVAEKTHRDLVSMLDRAAKRKALHANNVARKKARAWRMLIAEPSKEDKQTVRRAKKRPARAPKAEAAAKAPAKKAPAKAKAAEAEAPAAAEVEAPEAAEATPEAAAPAEEKKAPAKKPAAKKPAAKKDDAKADDKPKAEKKPAAKKAAPKKDAKKDDK